MGLLTRNELTTNVRTALDNRSVAALSNETIWGWLNHTLTHVCHPKVYKHPNLEERELVTLLAATNSYNLATDTIIVVGVRNTTAVSGYRLHPQNKRWFRDRAQDVTGRPSHYLRYGSLATRVILKVYPTPSAEYVGQVLEVQTYVYPTLFSDAAGDVASVIAAEWDEVLELGAIWRGWRTLQNPVLSDRYKGDYAAMINEIAQIEDLEKQEDQREFELGNQRLYPTGRYAR
jgi:hypothetical protein